MCEATLEEVKRKLNASLFLQRAPFKETERIPLLAQTMVDLKTFL